MNILLFSQLLILGLGYGQIGVALLIFAALLWVVIKRAERKNGKQR